MKPDSQDNNSAARCAGYLLVAIPCFAYLLLVYHYALNLPFFDDFAVILDDSIKIKYAQGWPHIREILFRQSSGHIPLVTRLLALAQTSFGQINFRILILLGNAGLVGSIILLCLYLARTLAVPVLYLAPVAFLLASPAHWEAMDFATPALQMYWGSLLAPVVCLIAMIEGFPIVSALVLVLAIYCSSGSLLLVPLTCIYLLWHKRWFDALVSGLILAFGLAIFFHFNRTYNDYRDIVPQVSSIISYMAAFIGNVFSCGQYDMTPYIHIYRSVGAMIIVVGFAGLAQSRKPALPVLIFIYVLLLGMLAAYARGVSWVPPRYAVFALLALAMVYVMYLDWLLHTTSRHLRIYLAATLILSIAFCAQGMYTGKRLLATNYQTRINAAARYLSGDITGLSQLVWSAEYGRAQLELAKEIHLYDMEAIRPYIDKQP